MIQDSGPRPAAMNKKQLATIYEVCTRTLNRWLSPHGAAIGPLSGRLYTPAQIAKIFDILGPPPR